GQELELVRLALDPRIRDRHLRAVEPPELVVVLRERSEPVVDDRLHDPDGVRAVVLERQLDLAGMQLRALNCDVLDRDPVALEPRRVERDEHADQRAEQHQRQQRGEPRGRSADGSGLHHTTSKKPIQPNSANSETWAWNMYLPSYGKRSSRIPRCPCPWMTVSVSSVGSSDVPVGK